MNEITLTPEEYAIVISALDMKVSRLIRETNRTGGARATMELRKKFRDTHNALGQLT